MTVAVKGWCPACTDEAMPDHDGGRVFRIGAKPEAVCWWAFEVVGAHPDDELHDLYPGTGAVTRAWDTWRRTLRLPLEVPS